MQQENPASSPSLLHPQRETAPHYHRHALSTILTLHLLSLPYKRETLLRQYSISSCSPTNHSLQLFAGPFFHRHSTQEILGEKKFYRSVGEPVAADSFLYLPSISSREKDDISHCHKSENDTSRATFYHLVICFEKTRLNFVFHEHELATWYPTANSQLPRKRPIRCI